MQNNRLPRLNPQLVLGLIIILLGVLFALDNLDLVDASRAIRYWPALLVVYGLSKLADAQNLPGRIWGSIAVTVGSLMLLDRLDVISFRLHDWWPVILIGLGGSLLFRSARKRPRPAIEQGTDATISLFALLGGFERSNSSQDFKGGEVTAIMGGCELDLRQASIQGEAIIDVFALWGGVNIKVPEDWMISVRGFPLMGAIEDKSRPPKGGSQKLLIVQGYAIMGGAEITN